MTEFEKELLAISQKNSENDIALRKQELDFKLANTKENENKASKLSTGQVTLLVAIIGLLGTFIGAILQGFFNQKLERQKFESELILKVMTANDVEQNRTNLKFILDAGLVREHTSELRELSNDTSFKVKIPSAGETETTEEVYGFIFMDENRTPISGAEVTIFLENNVISVITDRNGQFIIPHIPSTVKGQRIKLSVSKEGYAIYTMLAIVGFNPISIILQKK